MTKLTEYKQLLSHNYDTAVEFLFEKYGAAEDDYFSGKSYERFFKGEIKKITKGKFSRSADGLECHHDDENKFLHMTNMNCIKDQSIPFESHQKEKLVFCDVIEHAILHTLIAKETSLDLGTPGYTVFLRPKIQDWYINKIIPQKSKHHITCYHKAYIKPEEASELLEIMDKVLFIEGEKIKQRKQEKIKRIIEKGNFKSLNNDSPRSEIVRAMYDLKKTGASGYNYIFKEFIYSEEYGKRMYQPVEFRSFERNIKEYDPAGILKNILLYISYVEKKIDYQEYSSTSELYSKTKKEIENEQKIQKEKENLKNLEKLKAEEFFSTYPKFKKLDINYDVNRQEVNALLFKFNDQYKSFIKFQPTMKKYSLDELLKKLHSVMK